MHYPQDHYGFLSKGIRDAQEKIRLLRSEKDHSAKRRLRLENKRIKAYRDSIAMPAKELSKEERQKYARFLPTNPVVKRKTLLDQDRKAIGRRVYYQDGAIHDVPPGDMMDAMPSSGYVIKSEK